MVAITAAFIALALASPSFASPVPTAEEGLSVPIFKRGRLTTADGLFNATAAANSIAQTQAKMRAGLLAALHNTGSLPQGAFIPPLTNLTKRQSEALTDSSEELWYGTVSIGTPAQKFTIDFDTGSSDTWVASSACTSGCSGHTEFKIASSSTAVKQSGTFSISYGDGSTTSGPIYKDTITVGGIKVTGQTFSPVKSMSSTFTTDGLMGMAYQAISNLNASPFFNTAVTQGVVKAAKFAFYLASSGSELYLGGANSARYTGSIETHPVTEQQFWKIGGGKSTVNGVTIATGISTIIDSGTTLAYAPTTQVTAFYKAIGGSVYDASQGLYQYPCSTTVKAGFSWGGATWSINPTDFNLGDSGNNDGQCVGALGDAGDLGLGSGVWLVGDVFMRSQYTVFSFADNTVGFAQLA